MTFQVPNSKSISNWRPHPLPLCHCPVVFFCLLIDSALFSTQMPRFICVGFLLFLDLCCYYIYHSGFIVLAGTYCTLLSSNIEGRHARFDPDRRGRNFSVMSDVNLSIIHVETGTVSPRLALNSWSFFICVLHVCPFPEPYSYRLMWLTESKSNKMPLPLLLLVRLIVQCSYSL